MRQQINLYQPIFSEGRKPFSARIAGMGLGLVFAGLVGYALYSNAQSSKLEAAVVALRAEQTEQTTALDAAAEAKAMTEKPEIIQARVKELHRSIAERTAALEILKSGAAGQTSGFAARMEALARRHVEGLWIDRLMLSGTSGSMTLSGATLDADTVPVYLHSLAREPVLSGTRFDEFVIERPLKRAVAVEQTDADADPAAPAKSPAIAPAHIRFRAGSKALTADIPKPEDAT
jgi:Tfp pilus assembly protein PilN